LRSPLLLFRKYAYQSIGLNLKTFLHSKYISRNKKNGVFVGMDKKSPPSTKTPYYFSLLLPTMTIFRFRPID
jgi:hypothetical protein